MGNPENRIHTARGRVSAALAGALAITAIGGGASAAEAELPQPILREGQFPAWDGPITIFTSSQVETTVSIIPVKKIRSPRAAAEMFGGDLYSKDPDNWKINEFGGATLREDPSGRTHRVRTNGAVFEGYVRVPREGIDSIAFVVNPNDVPRMDFNGATAWLFKASDTEQGFKQVKKQVTDRLRGEQRGVNVEPANQPTIRGDRSVTPARIRNRRQAAEELGVRGDPYTRDRNNWEINDDGGASLVGDPTGLAHRINTDGEVAEGYINIDRPRGIDALSFVAMDRRRLDVYSATVWVPRKLRQLKALFGQVFRQKKENRQDGVLVIPIS